MSKLLETFEQDYLLGIAEMDDTHRQFVALLNQLDTAPDGAFADLFAELLQHTEAHFAAENQRMQETGFFAIPQHMGEHQRVLAELARFNRRVAAGDLALGRACVREYLPDWFVGHARTMDSALAAHIKSRQ